MKRRNKMGMMKEFRDFAVRGNVVDMAVGVVIGGAFGKIISSLVENIIMPPIGMIMGGLISQIGLSIWEKHRWLHWRKPKK